jgi:hypothetical protein
LFEHDLFGKPVPTFPDHAPAKQQEIRSFSGFFAGSRPCVFAPDPVSLLSSNAPPILEYAHEIVAVLSAHP